MSKQNHESWEIANRAFDLFTLAERARALEVFSRLQYSSLIDRFYEAVYRVIKESEHVQP